MQYGFLVLTVKIIRTIAVHLHELSHTEVGESVFWTTWYKNLSSTYSTTVPSPTP